MFISYNCLSIYWMLHIFLVWIWFSICGEQIFFYLWVSIFHDLKNRKWYIIIVTILYIKRANQRMQVRGNQLSVINFSGWVRYQCWLWSFHPTVQVTAFFRWRGRGTAPQFTITILHQITTTLLPTVSRLNIFLILRTIFFLINAGKSLVFFN